MDFGLSTFRDPAGTLNVDGERIFRDVHRDHSVFVRHFLNRPLIQKWVSEGRLISTVIAGELDCGKLRLEHQKVLFPAYPFEWCPTAWVSAADLTLTLCEEALEDGLTLKDATPYNVLFRGTEPVFVDVLSFERRDPENPIWPAYGQFVRTFLLPMAAYKFLGWPFWATAQVRDGFEPDDLFPPSPLAR